MTRSLVALCLLACPSLAMAEPPAPLSMPAATSDSDARGELLGAIRPDAAAAALAVSGRYSFADRERSGVELFARGMLIDATAGNSADVYAGLSYHATGAAIRFGGRARIALGPVTAMFAVWTADSTGFTREVRYSFASRPDAYDDLLGLSDPYTVAGVRAAGSTLDLHATYDCTFAEFEVGSALIDDARDGIAIDDVFGGIGVGGFLTRRVSLALEYRFVQEPTGSFASGAYLQHIALALGGIGPGLRFRAGLGAGVVLGVDYTVSIGRSRK